MASSTHTDNPTLLKEEQRPPSNEAGDYVKPTLVSLPLDTVVRFDTGSQNDGFNGGFN